MVRFVLNLKFDRKTSLSPLVKKMSKQQIEGCVDTLSKNLLQGAEEKRDVASMSLKIIIQKLPTEIAPGPIKNCLDKLLQTLQVS